VEKLVIALAFAAYSVGNSAYSAQDPSQKMPNIPEKIETLMRKAAILNNKCRSPGEYANGRICSARYDTYEHLRHLGWCWDSEKTDAIEADYHWMRCSLARTEQ